MKFGNESIHGSQAVAIFNMQIDNQAGDGGASKLSNHLVLNFP